VPNNQQTSQLLVQLGRVSENGLMSNYDRMIFVIYVENEDYLQLRRSFAVLV